MIQVSPVPSKGGLVPWEFIRFSSQFLLRCLLCTISAKMRARLTRNWDPNRKPFRQQMQTRLLHYHDGAVKVTKSAFYSNRITVGRPTATSFLKSKAIPNIDREKWKQTKTKNGTKSQIQKMQSSKFMQWNMMLKAILPIWLIITKQLKVARVFTSTKRNLWFSHNRYVNRH